MKKILCYSFWIALFILAIVANQQWPILFGVVAILAIPLASAGVLVAFPYAVFGDESRRGAWKLAFIFSQVPIALWSIASGNSIVIIFEFSVLFLLLRIFLENQLSFDTSEDSPVRILILLLSLLASPLMEYLVNSEVAYISLWMLAVPMAAYLLLQLLLRQFRISKDFFKWIFKVSDLTDPSSQ